MMNRLSTWHPARPQTHCRQCWLWASCWCGPWNGVSCQAKETLSESWKPRPWRLLAPACPVMIEPRATSSTSFQEATIQLAPLCHEEGALRASFVPLTYVGQQWVSAGLAALVYVKLVWFAAGPSIAGLLLPNGMLGTSREEEGQGGGARGSPQCTCKRQRTACLRPKTPWKARLKVKLVDCLARALELAKFVFRTGLLKELLEPLMRSDKATWNWVTEKQLEDAEKPTGTSPSWHDSVLFP